MTSKLEASTSRNRGAGRSGWKRRYVPADVHTLDLCRRLQWARCRRRPKLARAILQEWIAYLATLPAPDDRGWFEEHLDEGDEER